MRRALIEENEVKVAICSNEKQYVKMPRSLDDAKMLGRVLLRYRDRYLFTVLVGVATTYVL